MLVNIIWLGKMRSMDSNSVCSSLLAQAAYSLSNYPVRLAHRYHTMPTLQSTIAMVLWVTGCMAYIVGRHVLNTDGQEDQNMEDFWCLFGF